MCFNRHDFDFQKHEAFCRELTEFAMEELFDLKENFDQTSYVFFCDQLKKVHESLDKVRNRKIPSCNWMGYAKNPYSPLAKLEELQEALVLELEKLRNDGWIKGVVELFKEK